MPARPDLADLAERLGAINAELWDLETEARHLMERADNDGIARIARKIFQLNETRSATKAEIDVLLLGESGESKIYNVKEN